MNMDSDTLKYMLRNGSISPHEIAKMTIPDRVEILLDGLQHLSGIDARAVVQALPLSNQIEAPLIALLQPDLQSSDIYDFMLQDDAVMKLSALRTERALSEIRSWTQQMMIRKDDYRSLAAQGILALAYIKDSGSLDLFRQGLRQSNRSIVAASIFAVGEMKDSESLEILIRLLTNKRPDPLASEQLICDTAAEALGKIGNERAIKPLTKLIISKKTGMHPVITLRALGSLGVSGLAALTELTQNEDDQLRANAQYALTLVKKEKGG